MDLDRLAGVTEIAVAINVDRRRVSRWIERRDANNFPRPVRSLGMGDLYDLDQVITWYDSWCATRRQTSWKTFADESR